MVSGAPVSRPLVEVQNLRVRFGPDGPWVVKDVSFTINRGECVALVGESGSGKSVTARTLLGLAGARARIAADRLAFLGEDITRFTERDWRRTRGARVGLVMQDALGSLDPLRRVGDEIGEALKLHTNFTGPQRRARVIELLKLVGMPEPALRARHYPHQLSGGLRQRALIASALSCEPALLIADEPTTALDATIQAHVLELLRNLRTEDTGMLVISHDLAVVSRLADRIVVMHRGSVVEEGGARDVLHSPRHPYTRSLLAAHTAIHARNSHASSTAIYLPLRSPNGFTTRFKAFAAKPRAAGKDPVLEARSLGKTFAGHGGERRTAVAGASLVLHPGETLGIVGESGSGKTTLVRMILGLEKPDAGSVLLRGADWAALSGIERRRARRHIQIVFQDPLGSFDPRHTVEKVLFEALELSGQASGVKLSRAIELLGLVRLDKELLSRRPLELSGGQRQRVAIARALAANPDILVCDEPVSALDVSVQAQILDLLADLRSWLGLSCLFISHDLGIVRRICDRLIVMKDGSIIEAGDVEDVFENPAHPYTRSLLAAIPRLEAPRAVATA